MRKLMTKGDMALIAALLLAGLVLFLPWLRRAPASRVTVYAAGEQVFSCPLSAEESFVWRDGEDFVRVEVAGGRVWVAESSCPDKDCVHRGRQDRAGASIVCLPNRVTVLLSGEAEEDGPDAVLY